MHHVFPFLLFHETLSRVHSIMDCQYTIVCWMAGKKMQPATTAAAAKPKAAPSSGRFHSTLSCLDSCPMYVPFVSLFLVVLYQHVYLATWTCIEAGPRSPRYCSSIMAYAHVHNICFEAHGLVVCAQSLCVVLSSTPCWACLNFCTRCCTFMHVFMYTHALMCIKCVCMYTCKFNVFVRACVCVCVCVCIYIYIYIYILHILHI
jgi:hypothetical protein